MITQQEVKDLKPFVAPWTFLAQIQCTKSPHVVNRTAELLSEVGQNRDVKPLKG